MREKQMLSPLGTPLGHLSVNGEALQTYKIPCADCRNTCTGKTGRPFRVRHMEHQKEV